MEENYQFKHDLDYILERVGEKLLTKNKNYGNAALEPVNIFSKNPAIEQLKTSIDHKLSRIKNVGFDGDGEEDSLDDLIGYLVLLKIELLNRRRT